MELVFWQNMISIHQKDFLEALAVHEHIGKVILMAQEDISEERKNMGWHTPDLKNIETIIAPDTDQINDIIRQYPDAVHVFSGFNVGALNVYAMKNCISKKRRIAIMSEPYNLAGKKGFVRKVKFQLDKFRYQKRIDFILAIGREGVSQFREIGFAPAKVFPWAYFIDMPAELQQPKTDAPTGKCKIMYAGRVEEPKGIYRFANALLKHGDNYELHIYGEGSDSLKIKGEFVFKDKADMLYFYPFLKYDDLLKQYAKYDWLVLPSTQKDGWGAVVSEALLNGLKVICSTKAGASLVIQDGRNGVTFDWLKEGDCDAAIQKMLTGKGFQKPSEIIDHANRSLTGKAGADYFVRILKHKYQQVKRPDTPWL